MILLNLVFLAQSFGFETSVQRTPYIVNSLTGETFVENVNTNGLRFEICKLPSYIHTPLENINRSDLSCRSITNEIRFSSEGELQAIRKQFSEKFLRHLEVMNNRDILKDTFVTLAFVPGSFFSASAAYSFFRGYAGFVLPGMVAGVAFLSIAYLGLNESFRLLDLRDNKLKQAKINIKKLANQPVVIFADDSKLMKLYETAAQSMTPNFESVPTGFLH